MNKEYIERESAIAFLENMAASRYLIQCFESKERFPAADVEPVRYGKWIEIPFKLEHEWDTVKGYATYKCSECGRQEDKREPYCHCGAKMDGKDCE